MNKKNLEQTELSYYGLYLLNYLKENKFEQASDAAFVKARADEAAEAYERARLEGYTPDGAQEIAMSALVHGLHYSRYAILREVVFSIYDLSDDQFALSSDYDLLYTELTGAVVLYLREYGI